MNPTACIAFRLLLVLMHCFVGFWACHCCHSAPDVYLYYISRFESQSPVLPCRCMLACFPLGYSFGDSQHTLVAGVDWVGGMERYTEAQWLGWFSAVYRDA
jgi:hypothetical protein